MSLLTLVSHASITESIDATDTSYTIKKVETVTVADGRTLTKTMTTNCGATARPPFPTGPEDPLLTARILRPVGCEATGICLFEVECKAEVEQEFVNVNDKLDTDKHSEHSAFAVFCTPNSNGTCPKILDCKTRGLSKYTVNDAKVEDQSPSRSEPGKKNPTLAPPQAFPR